MDLKNEIFGEKMVLDKHRWMKLSHSPELQWLFSFDSIREKVHTEAKVKMLHVNQQEAEKLLNRLK